jgi:DNA-binding NarL/FixJ family response regulator
VNEPPKLTKREREIVELLHCGYDPAEIAARLTIRVATVRKHIEHIAEKVPGELTPIRRIRRAARDLLLAS